jgi:integrase
VSRLTDKTIKAAIAKGEPAKLKAGGSLYLWIRGNSASWIHHFREGASMRTRSLGTYPDLSTFAAIKARETFSAERRGARIERRGLAVRNSAEPARESKGVTTIKRMRFADVVESFLIVNAPQWKAESSEPRKYRHLKTGALGKLWADEIDQTHVETELQTRWGHALASADKYRMRIMQLISFAVAKGLRNDGPNPARKEVIKHLVPNAPKSKPHKAMRSGDVPALMADLVADGSNEARALAFLILTMTRTAEAREADWREIDVKDKLWIIPGERMKENVEHRVPLSPQALALLGKPKKSGRVFGELPHDALIEKLNELRPGGGYTVHGMRTAFRGDWALKNGYPVELREMALAHSVGDAVIQAYSLPPAELYTVRIPMTLAWNGFCTGSAK